MATITVFEKTNTAGNPVKLGDVIRIDAAKLIGVKTKSLHIRKGFMNGTLFLSQRHFGIAGAGDICPLGSDATIQVSGNLFMRIKDYATKAGAII